MRSLALLLFLVNLSAFVWQLGFFPWLPWQPEQFITTSSSHNTTTNLPTLHLLHETINNEVTVINPEIVTAMPNTISEQLVQAATLETANNNQEKQSPDTYDTQKIGFLSQLATHAIGKVASTVQYEIIAEIKKTSTEKPVTNETPKQILSIETKSYCYEIGPYSKNTHAQQAANWFKTQKALENKVETRKTPVLSSTRVYLPPYASRQAAKEVEKQLNQQNIADRMIITQGELTNGISLGVYRDQESVERRLKQLKEKGYANVQTEKRYKTDTMYWLSVKIETVELLDTFKKAQQTPIATSVQCK